MLPQAGAARAVFTLRVENQEGGRVQARAAGSADWKTLGSVARAAVTTAGAFPAAAFVPASRVAATAVHGIRIRVPSSGRDPVSISIQPLEFRTMPEGYGGHIPGRSAILTDIPAGRAIFRELAPLVGDAVQLESDGRTLPLPEDWRPGEGDVLLIECSESDSPASAVEFENRPGGAVTQRMADGTARRIGTVRQPVTGVGRFDGTSYTGVGALNTNHGGVITVSTAPESRPPDEGAPPESRGGFEIQPYQHARTQPDMTQAMIVAPLDGALTLEGAPPLFSGALPLGDGSNVVDVRIGEGDWCPMPAITGKVSDAFTAAGLARLGIAPGGAAGVTAIRIRPQHRDPKALASVIAKLALPELPGTEGGKPLRIVWALKMPYPPEASYAAFSREGRTVAISSIQPFEAKLDITDRVTVFRADIISADGRKLASRAATVRFSGGKLVLAESR